MGGPARNGDDDGVDVFAGEEFFEGVVALLGVLDGFELKFLRDDREGFEAPETVFLLVDILGHEEFDDVADGRRDHVFVVLVVVAFLGDFTEGAGKIGSALVQYRGFRQRGFEVVSNSLPGYTNRENTIV